MTLDTVIARHCAEVVTRHKWNRRAASRELGISPNTLRKYLRLAGLEPTITADEPLVDALAVIRAAHDQA